LVAFTRRGREHVAPQVEPDPKQTKLRQSRAKPTSDYVKEVSRWVGGTWVYARNPDRSPRGAMVKKSTFMTQVKNFDPVLYDKLLSRAISLGFIVDGICVEKDQEKIIEKMVDNQS
jgi:hypothetical protein